MYTLLCRQHVTSCHSLEFVGFFQKACFKLDKCRGVDISYLLEIGFVS